jgi:hypothetical protein
MKNRLTCDFPLCYENGQVHQEPSREKGFGDHIAVLVVADLKRLPTQALKQ